MHREDFGRIPPARRHDPIPGEGRRPVVAPGFGLPCPDAGYALFLAALAVEHLVLEFGDRRDDAECAIATVAVRRAGMLGRAPLLQDVEIGRTLLAYDQPTDADFARWRARWICGIARDVDLRQRLADAALASETLRPPLDADAVHGWRATLRQRFDACATSS
jgi:hypothetical protein